jgi:hypothetical protein
MKMNPLIDSQFEEVPGPHRGSLRRELFRVYRGRFCFRIGAGIRCGGDTSLTISKGERVSLELSGGLAAPGGIATIGAKRAIEHEHVFSQQIGPWTVEECESISPVLCFNDAEVRIFRNRRPIRRYHLSAFSEEFLPRAGDLGWVYQNRVRNDPFCECHDPSVPTSVDREGEESEERPPRFVIARPTALVANVPSDGRRENPDSAAEEAGAAMAEILAGGDGDDSEGEPLRGVARSDGFILWLDEARAAGGPSLVTLPWGASSSQRGVNTFDLDLVPLIAVGPSTETVSCDLRVYVQRPGEAELQILVEEQAAVHVNDLLTTVWCEVDFSGLDPETNGVVEMQLRDAGENEIGHPVREPFLVDPLTVTRVHDPVH